MIKTVAPVLITSIASTDGPGSARRASVGVSMIKPYFLVRMELSLVASTPKPIHPLASRSAAFYRLPRYIVGASHSVSNSNFSDDKPDRNAGDLRIASLPEFSGQTTKTE